MEGSGRDKSSWDGNGGVQPRQSRDVFGEGQASSASWAVASSLALALSRASRGAQLQLTMVAADCGLCGVRTPPRVCH